MAAIEGNGFTIDGSRAMKVVAPTVHFFQNIFKIFQFFWWNRKRKGQGDDCEWFIRPIHQKIGRKTARNAGLHSRVKGRTPDPPCLFLSFFSFPCCLIGHSILSLLRIPLLISHLSSFLLILAAHFFLSFHPSHTRGFPDFILKKNLEFP